MKKNYVVVTTDKEKRGVFAGFLEEDKSPEYVVLKEARMVVYFSKETRSVLGLAAKGPQEGSRVSYPAPQIKLFGITMIASATAEAINNFEENKWS